MNINKVTDNSYTQISGWMVNKLNLKGNELLIYSIIYSYSRDGQGLFFGSLQYLSEFTNSSKRSVINNLQSLVDKELIEKREVVENNVKYCQYRCKEVVGIVDFYSPSSEKSTSGGEENALGSEKNALGDENSSLGGGEKISPNNKSNNNKNLDNKNNNKNNNKKKGTSSSKEDSVPKEKVPYEEIVNMFNSICVSYPKVTKISTKRRTHLRARFKDYSLEDFKTTFKNMEESRFLKGNNYRNWSATFDWTISSEDNMAKVFEGNYKNKDAEDTSKRYKADGSVDQEWEDIWNWQRKEG